MIISILMAGGTIWLVSARKTADINATKTLISVLHEGCQTYYARYRSYPPSDVTKDNKYKGSQNLHYYLGAELKEDISHSTDPSAPKMSKTNEPIISFKSEWLEGKPKDHTLDKNKPRYVIDTWEHKIIYKNPHPDNKRSFLIMSYGPNGIKDEKDDIYDIEMPAK